MSLHPAYFPPRLTAGTVGLGGNEAVGRELASRTEALTCMHMH
jgi:hypothetical protein